MTSDPWNDHPLRVLVVDDDHDSADSTAIHLSLLGYPVRLAQDSQEALSVASTWQPDLALLDLGMQRIDGILLARALREVPGLAGLELVAVAGITELQAQAQVEGFRAYLLKPMELPALLRVLDDIAQRKGRVRPRETMPGAERIGAARVRRPKSACLELAARSRDWMLRAGYVASLSRRLGAGTRAELPATRALIARWRSVVQEGRVRIARGNARKAIWLA